ncbi:Metallo-dependent phosphatase-like protein [Cladochytrium replicatum]|nr:Metallo-dependent phosphatase-like protein [Cladochytrium replicatum]
MLPYHVTVRPGEFRSLSASRGVTIRVQPYDTLQPPEAGWTRVVCVSDTHLVKGFDYVPPGDILLHSGDATMVGAYQELQQFAAWLGRMPHRHKIFIAGNHDISLDPMLMARPNTVQRWRLDRHGPVHSSEACRALFNDPAVGVTFLEDSSCEVRTGPGVSDRLLIYGSPWQPTFGHWAFNLDRGLPIAEKWKQIPADVDILLTHGPPHGILDQTDSEIRAGCEMLRDRIFRPECPPNHPFSSLPTISPAMHLFGHIHEGYGVERHGNTLFVNASVCDLRYKPSQRPIVLDVKRESVQEDVEMTDESL